MKITEFSTAGLRSLYEGVRIALAQDDALPAAGKLFEVRELRDWRQWSDEIEAELRRRNVDVAPLPW